MSVVFTAELRSNLSIKFCRCCKVISGRRPNRSISQFTEHSRIHTIEDSSIFSRALKMYAHVNNGYTIAHSSICREEKKQQYFSLVLIFQLCTHSTETRRK